MNFFINKTTKGKLSNYVLEIFAPCTTNLCIRRIHCVTVHWLLVQILTLPNIHTLCHITVQFLSQKVECASLPFDLSLYSSLSFGQWEFGKDNSQGLGMSFYIIAVSCPCAVIMGEHTRANLLVWGGADAGG